MWNTLSWWGTTCILSSFSHTIPENKTWGAAQSWGCQETDHWRQVKWGVSASNKQGSLIRRDAAGQLSSLYLTLASFALGSAWFDHWSRHKLFPEKRCVYFRWPSPFTSFQPPLRASPHSLWSEEGSTEFESFSSCFTLNAHWNATETGSFNLQIRKEQLLNCSAYNPPTQLSAARLCLQNFCASPSPFRSFYLPKNQQCSVGYFVVITKENRRWWKVPPFHCNGA